MRKTEYPAALRNLVAQLRQMPGVGPRSAERIALWMVQARTDKPEEIARAISETRQSIHPCKLCGYFTTSELCEMPAATVHPVSRERTKVVSSGTPSSDTVGSVASSRLNISA